MTPRFSIGVIWQDDDLVEIEAAACTEHFSGLTQVYTTYDELRKLHASLIVTESVRSIDTNWDNFSPHPIFHLLTPIS